MKCRIDSFENGSVSLYPKKPETTAFCIGEEGQNILAITKPPRFVLPSWELSAMGDSFSELTSQIVDLLQERITAIRETHKAEGLSEGSTTTMVLAFHSVTVVCYPGEKFPWQVAMWVGLGCFEEGSYSLEGFPRLARPVTIATYDERFPFEKFPDKVQDAVTMTQNLKAFFGFDHDRILPTL